MKKNDLILGAAVIATALAMLFFLHLSVRIGGQESENISGRRVCVRVDGEVWETRPLNEDGMIEVKLDSGYNRIRIESGEAYMEEADCPDGYCMKQGHISGGINTIICLPHKLVVEIVDGEENIPEEGVDSVAK